MLGVRPESFALGKSDGVRFEGVIKVVESLGRETLLYVDTAPLAVVRSEAQQQNYVAVHQASQQSHLPDAPIALTVDRRDIFLFDTAGRTIRFPDHAPGRPDTDIQISKKRHEHQCVTVRSISTSTPRNGFPASAPASIRKASAGHLPRPTSNSVTIFAKCHHGWSYHPTKVGKQHPNLDFDLTRAQLDSLHAQGINAPIYVSAGWDELAARDNPGWRVVTPEGVLIRQRGEPLGPGWAFLDFNSPYLDYLCRQVDEVVDLFPDGDGIFIDIFFALETASTWAQAKMEARAWTGPARKTG